MLPDFGAESWWWQRGCLDKVEEFRLAYVPCCCSTRLSRILGSRDAVSAELCDPLPRRSF